MQPEDIKDSVESSNEKEVAGNSYNKIDNTQNISDKLIKIDAQLKTNCTEIANLKKNIDSFLANRKIWEQFLESKPKLVLASLTLGGITWLALLWFTAVTRWGDYSGTDSRLQSIERRLTRLEEKSRNRN